MVNRYSFRNKIVRAGFYISSIGGLMMLFAGLLWVCWNRMIADRMQYAPLSFLEAVGLVSIAYIVYSSIRFSSVAEDCTEQKVNIHAYEAAASGADAPPAALSELNGVQREQLKREIERCCGKKAVESVAETGVEHS